MPTGPKGQKRPADVIGNAVRIARIATGEEPDEGTEHSRIDGPIKTVVLKNITSSRLPEKKPD